MANSYNVKAGQVLTATADEGRIQVLEKNTQVGTLTFGSISYGPFLVDREFLVDGEATVSIADYTTSLSAMLFTNAGVPDDAAQATASVNPAGDDNALTFTAKAYGTVGNAITVTYADPGAASQSLAVTVTDQNIVVSLATNGGSAITSTAADVLAAINASVPAARLVTVAIDATDTGVADDGSGVVTAMAVTAFTGGAGTGIGTALPGAICIDTTNSDIYRNDGTQAIPVWVKVGDAP